jgi:hypothetical protein
MELDIEETQISSPIYSDPLNTRKKRKQAGKKNKLVSSLRWQQMGLR